MTKSNVVRTWLGGLIALAGGLVLMALSIGLMLGYGGTFTQSSDGQVYDFVPKLDGFFWTTVVGIVFGCLLAAIGGLVQLVAWIAAMINTFQLEDKTWFAVLLAGGLVGLVVGVVGFVAMVAYVIAGPDGTAVRRSPTAIGAQPGALAPSA